MMKLRSSPASPFGRKVKIALAVLGLKDRVEVENADTADPSDSLRGENPLGKIPALILEDGDILYDSAVILEYLDFLAGSGRLFPEGEARFKVLRDQALADGILDAAILRVYEKRFKEPKYRDPAWDAYQAAKMNRGLAHFETHAPAPSVSSETLDAATITLACTLGYLDLRFGGQWRQDHPKLVAWLNAFEAAVPAFAAGKLPPHPSRKTQTSPCGKASRRFRVSVDGGHRNKKADFNEDRQFSDRSEQGAGFFGIRVGRRRGMNPGGHLDRLKKNVSAIAPSYWKNASALSRGTKPGSRELERVAFNWK